MSEWVKKSLIALLILYVGYIIVVGEVRQRGATMDFCKEQCNYNPDKKTWDINLKWFFDENKVESRMDTEKSFSEKDFDGCINYCKDLESEYKYLTQ